MKIKVSQTSQTPIYEQIEQQIRQQIFSGELKAGEQLLSIRALARELRIGIITAKRAYDDLCNENILVSRQGKGVYVAELDRELLREKRCSDFRKQAQQLITAGREAGLTLEEIHEILEEEGKSGAFL